MIEEWLKTFWSFLSGAFFMLIGYFLPVKNIVLLLLLFFVLDSAQVSVAAGVSPVFQPGDITFTFD